MPSIKLMDCDPELVAKWGEVLADYHPDGRALILTCSYRSPEEQWALFKVGRYQLQDGSWAVDSDAGTSIVTQLDGIVHKSKHNLHPARALDFAVTVGGKVSWDIREYAPVGALAKQHGLVWGGDWKTLKDAPHVELP